MNEDNLSKLGVRLFWIDIPVPAFSLSGHSGFKGHDIKGGWLNSRKANPIKFISSIALILLVNFLPGQSLASSSLIPFTTKVTKLDSSLAAVSASKETAKSEAKSKANSEEKSFRQTIDIELQRRRTLVTHALFSQVLVDMLNSSGKVVTLGKGAALSKDSVQCLINLSDEWRLRAASGRFALTQDILQQLNSWYYVSQLTPTCREVTNQLIGTGHEAHTHGMFLAKLQSAELKFSFREQKLAQLEAAYQSLTMVHDSHLEALSAVANYFAQDADAAISSGAKVILNQLQAGQWSKGRAIFSYVGTGVIPEIVAGVKGPLFLVKRLLQSGLIKSADGIVTRAITWSLLIHGGVAFHVAKQNEAAQEPAGKYAVPLEFAPPGFRHKDYAIWLNSLSNDLFTNAALGAVVSESIRRYVSLKDDRFDFASFFIEAEFNANQAHHEELVRSSLDRTSIKGLEQIQNFNSIIESINEVVRDSLGQLTFSKTLEPESNNTVAEVTVFRAINSVRRKVFEATSLKNYRIGETSLAGLYQGEKNGNCVANTKLMLSVFWPMREKLPLGWRLGVQLFQDHLMPVIFKVESLGFGQQVKVIDLVSGQVTREVQSPILHPYMFLNGWLIKNKQASIDWRQFVLLTPSGHLSGANGDQLSYVNKSDPSIYLPGLHALGVQRYTNEATPLQGVIDFKEIELQALYSKGLSSNGRNSLKPFRRLTHSTPVGAKRILSPEQRLEIDPSIPEFTWALKFSGLGRWFEGTIFTPGAQRKLAFGSVVKSEDSRLTGYEILMPSKAERLLLEKLESDSERSGFFERSALKRLSESSLFVERMFAALMDPDKVDFNSWYQLESPDRVTKTIQYIFDLHFESALAAELQRIDDLKTSTLTAAQGGRSSLAFDQLMANSEFLKLEGFKTRLFEEIIKNPERLAYLFDSPRVSFQTKVVFLDFINALRAYLRLEPGSFAGGKKIPNLKNEMIVEKHLDQVAEVLNSFLVALNDPARIGISNKLALRLKRPAVEPTALNNRGSSDFVLSKNSIERFEVSTVDIAVRLAPEEKSAGCREQMSAGKCRTQSFEFDEKESAKIYVEPRTFFFLAKWLNGPMQVLYRVPGASSPQAVHVLAKRRTTALDKIAIEVFTENVMRLKSAGLKIETDSFKAHYFDDLYLSDDVDSFVATLDDENSSIFAAYRDCSIRSQGDLELNKIIDKFLKKGNFGTLPLPRWPKAVQVEFRRTIMLPMINKYLECTARIN
jgi:hypothetical protein